MLNKTAYVAYAFDKKLGGIIMSTPNELRYSEEHEWVKVEGDKVRAGITDFAQHALGDIVFVELPEVGQKLKRANLLEVWNLLKQYRNCMRLSAAKL